MKEYNKLLFLTQVSHRRCQITPDSIAGTPNGEYPGYLHVSTDELQSPGSWSIGSTGVPGPAEESPKSGTTPAAAPSLGIRIPLSKSVPNLKGFLNSNHKQQTKK